MLMEEMPLLVFTFLCQLAFGSFVGLGLYRLSLARAGERAQASRVVWPLAAIAAGVVGIGIAASFFHVGIPLKAAGMLGNLGTSWLSREILTTALFFAATIAFAAALARNAPKTVINSLFAVGVAFGIAMVASMGCSYASIDAVPAWAAWTTLPLFFVSTALLGCAGTLVFALAQSRAFTGAARGAVRAASLAGIVFLSVQSVLVVGWVLALAQGGSEGAALSLAALQAGEYSLLLPLSLLSSVAATALAGALAFADKPAEAPMGRRYAVSACGLAAALFACGLLMKILFYAVAANVLPVM